MKGVAIIVVFALLAASAQAYDTIIWVRSATTEQNLQATCTVSQTGASGTTDMSGMVQLSAGSGRQTVDIACAADGYIPHSRRLDVSYNLHNFFFYLSPSLSHESNVARIVLEWDDAPRDLDATLISTNNGRVYYGDKEVADGDMMLRLDVDDTDGHGPETITVTHPTAQWYHYVIHRYSGSGSLADADPYVAVYSSEVNNEAAFTFDIPRGNHVMDYYHPFTLRSVQCTKPSGVVCQATYLTTGTGYRMDFVPAAYAPGGGVRLMAGCSDGTSSAVCNFPAGDSPVPTADVNTDDDPVHTMGDDHDDNKDDGGSVLGLIAFLALLLFIIVLTVVCCRRCKKRGRARRSETPVAFNLNVSSTPAAAPVAPPAAPPASAIYVVTKDDAAAVAPATRAPVYPPQAVVVGPPPPPTLTPVPMAVFNAPPPIHAAPLPMAPVAGSVARKDVSM